MASERWLPGGRGYSLRSAPWRHLRGVLALCSVIVVLGCGQGASQAGSALHPFRVGVLIAQDPTGGAPLLTLLRGVLNTDGWSEGRNYVLDVRYASGAVEKMPALVAELVRDKPDVLFAGTDDGAIAARGVTSSIPIVSVMCGDPVQEGLIQSLARPGGNVTGVLLGCVGGRIHAKELELLHEALPGLQRAGVLLDSTISRAQAVRQELEAAAQALNVQLQFFELRTVADLPSILAAPEAAGLGGLVVADDVLRIGVSPVFVAAIAQAHLPAIYDQRSDVEVGGLMAFGANLPAMRRQAFLYLKRILQGAKPADLPVLQPTTFDLVLNLETAHALGITFPDTVLAQTTDVIR